MEYASQALNERVALYGPTTMRKRLAIERAHYLTARDSYPTASAYLVAAPAGVHDKQRPKFEEWFTQLTGRDGTGGTPLRELPELAPRRRTGGVVLVRGRRPSAASCSLRDRAEQQRDSRSSFTRGLASFYDVTDLI